MGSKPDKGGEDVNNIVKAAAQNILANPEDASPRLVAWAYGCCREGSEEEVRLLALLKMKLTVQ